MAILRLRLGTRGSKLALAQSEMIAAALQAAHPGLQVELQVISTIGDRVLDLALAAVGEKGLFVKEIEQALLEGSIDLAVHSCKDLPSILPPGLLLAAFPEREVPWDALVLPQGSGYAGLRDAAFLNSGSPPELQASLPMLPQAARVGTSSLRRACQLQALRPDLQLSTIRGNVDTRLRKLDEGQYDAIVLAAAGLRRLGLHSRISALFPAELMLPAVAQGILAIEARSADQRTLELLSVLDDTAARTAALAERAFLRRLEGGCQLPIGAYAELLPGQPTGLYLRGMIGSSDGNAILSAAGQGSPAAAEALGSSLADQLKARLVELPAIQYQVAAVRGTEYDNDTR